MACGTGGAARWNYQAHAGHSHTGLHPRGWQGWERCKQPPKLASGRCSGDRLLHLNDSEPFPRVKRYTFSFLKRKKKRVVNIRLPFDRSGEAKFPVLNADQVRRALTWALEGADSHPAFA